MLDTRGSFANSQRQDLQPSAFGQQAAEFILHDAGASAPVIDRIHEHVATRLEYLGEETKG